MAEITSHGYPDYPAVDSDVEIPSSPAPEKLLPEYTGGYDAIGNGGPKGVQPGFDVPGVSPTAPNFGAVFGPQAG